MNMNLNLAKANQQVIQYPLVAGSDFLAPNHALFVEYLADDARWYRAEMSKLDCPTDEWAHAVSLGYNPDGCQPRWTDAWPRDILCMASPHGCALIAANVLGGISKAHQPHEINFVVVGPAHETAALETLYNCAGVSEQIIPSLVRKAENHAEVTVLVILHMDEIAIPKDLRVHDTTRTLALWSAAQTPPSQMLAQAFGTQIREEDGMFSLAFREKGYYGKFHPTFPKDRTERQHR